MNVIAGLGGALVIVVILIDVFETIVLPRRVTRRFRLTRILYRATWLPWRSAARLVTAQGRREAILSIYGPLSLLLLLVLWAGGLIVGFALLQWANGSDLRAPDAHPDFGTDLYFSASTLFTLGLGDVAPRVGSGLARPLAMIEAGGGFGVLALVIGYLPALYQAFSRREVAVSLLDARAGSPPSAATLLRRYAGDGARDDLNAYLREWESWAAELMESHLSYPMLAYFRSQHDNQSWLAALTTILDTCALVQAGVREMPAHTATLTFAMGRHALVDLAQIFGTPPRTPRLERLTPADMERLRALLVMDGAELEDAGEMARTLAELRASYEPYAAALGRLFDLPLPPWLPPEHITENWRSTAWDTRGATQF